MGEFALFNGNRIKIGTCESLYYLRADQVKLVSSEPGTSVNIKNTSVHETIRFRFPFPDEDNIKPGDFRDHSRGVKVPGIVPPEGIDHYNKSIKKMTLGNIARQEYVEKCSGGKDLPIKIVQQKHKDGKLMVICECGECGKMWRIEQKEDAQKIADALYELAGKMPSLDHTFAFYNTLADRIMSGYDEEAVKKVFSS